MGAIVVILTLAAGAAIRAAITTGCPLGTYARAAHLLVPMARIAERVAPRLRIGPMFGLDALTHDPEVQRIYAEDPLVERAATLRLLTEVALALRAARAAAPSITTPWLAAHGAEDRIAPAAGSRDLIERLGSADKRLSIYAGLRHELHNEVPPGPEQFLRELHEWVMDHGARMR
jgi:alpha-beta hydrolase superfamily lysophospholipase